MQRQLDDSLYIQTAGLVIVAPFLAHLFAELNLTQENQFVNSASQQRAVQLLGYVATGNSEVEEYLLPLAKVLCGMPITHPIVIDTPLKAAEMELANSMLNAVLQNWDKMSNSTIENLRGSFLLREGRLDEDETGFHLIVEQKGFDIILSFLPWSITTIELPWMIHALQVDWNTSLS